MASVENKNYSIAEMMVHVPLCTHAEPNKVLVVGEVEDILLEELKKHTAEVKCVEKLESENKKVYDVIIYLGEILDDALMANVERIITNNGIFVAKTAMPQKNMEKVKSDLTTIGKNFWISMPYSFGHNVCVIGSKKFHPQADIVLQRSDLLNDLSYYSTEIQNASFVFPAYIHRELTGIAKR